MNWTLYLDIDGAVPCRAELAPETCPLCGESRQTWACEAERDAAFLQHIAQQTPPFPPPPHHHSPTLTHTHSLTHTRTDRQQEKSNCNPGQGFKSLSLTHSPSWTPALRRSRAITQQQSATSENVPPASWHCIGTRSHFHLDRTVSAVFPVHLVAVQEGYSKRWTPLYLWKDVLLEPWIALWQHLGELVKHEASNIRRLHRSAAHGFKIKCSPGSSNTRKKRTKHWFPPPSS